MRSQKTSRFCDPSVMYHDVTCADDHWVVFMASVSPITNVLWYPCSADAPLVTVLLHERLLHQCTQPKLFALFVAQNLIPLTEARGLPGSVYPWHAVRSAAFTTPLFINAPPNETSSSSQRHFCCNIALSRPRMALPSRRKGRTKRL